MTYNRGFDIFGFKKSKFLSFFARLLVYRASLQKDEGQLGNGMEVSQAKYFAGEAAVKCANYAMRIMGDNGCYSAEYPIARFYRDVPTYVMVEGFSNICKTIVA